MPSDWERVAADPRLLAALRRRAAGPTDPLDRLWLDHTVKVIKSETLVTYVSEVVKAADRDPAGAGFATPLADLAEIGADPVLVMPLPPPGENGCPAWSLDGENISCSTTEDTPDP